MSKIQTPPDSFPQVLFDHLLGETDGDRLAILDKVAIPSLFLCCGPASVHRVSSCQVSLSTAGEQEVITYCREHEDQLSYRAVISTVRELKVSP